MTVDTATGTVTNATMFQSTGSPLLDKLTIQTFKSWRFKPGTVSQVRVPISYGNEVPFLHRHELRPNDSLDNAGIVRMASRTLGESLFDSKFASQEGNRHVLAATVLNG